jgi:hypothetical protein
VRGVLLLTAVLLLSACARDPAVVPDDTVRANRWQIEQQTDRITGAPLESALLRTRSSHTSEVFPQPAVLQLACLNKRPVVRFAFEVKVATTNSHEFGYRFDDRPGHQITASILGNNTVAVIEDGAAVAEFLGEMATAKTLYVRIRSLSFGRTAAEFNVEGAPAAMAATTAHCPPIIEGPKPKRKFRR